MTASHLREIANLQPGYAFREKIEPLDDGEFQVVQIKDVNGNGTLSVKDLIRTQVPKVKPEYLLRKGDVLFTTRGVSRRACFVGEDMPGTVFVAQLFAIRVKDERVEPAYVAWYINQKPAQDYLDAMASGSFIQNIKKDVLAAMEITIPSLEVQRKIIEVYRLASREGELVRQIEERRGQIIDKVLLNVINNGDIR